MPVAVWSSQLATGIADIDRQHQQLFDVVNQLDQAIRAGAATSQVPACVEFLLGYAVDHFKTEENYMQWHGYAGLTAHRAEHAKLVRRVLDLKDKVDGGEPVTEEITTFLSDWLTHHISKVDLAYVDYLKAKGVG